MARKHLGTSRTTFSGNGHETVSHSHSITVGISRSKAWWPSSVCSGDNCDLDAARDAAWEAAYFADNDLACCLEIAIIAVRQAFKGSGELRHAARLQTILDELRALRGEV